MAYGRQQVGKESVLAQVTDYDLFRHYCGGFDVVNNKFSSEFREDTNPSCIIGRWGDKLYYKDFAEPNNYDAIAYIMRKHSVNFMQALCMINRDFDLGLGSTYPTSKLPMSGSVSGIHYNVDVRQFSAAPTILRIKARKWQAKDGEYWKHRYGISLDTLRKYRVVPIERYWYSGKKGHSMIITSFHAYAYFCGYMEDGRESWKIYQPYSNSDKWMSNVPGKYLQGYDELPWLGDLLIITKALKDVMVLDQLGYNAVAPHGENFVISKELMATIRHRFTRVVILYDNDGPGIRAAEALARKHELEAMFLPEGTKDVSDFVESYDYDTLDQLLIEMMENDRRENMDSRDT